MSSSRCRTAAVTMSASAVVVLVVLLLCGASVSAAATAGAATTPYKLKEDCPARHLTDDNFEHDTQASGGTTSGNWLILFVPSNDGATAERFSQQSVTEVESFDAFVRLSPEVLSTYQVIPAYVLCDESAALCERFKVEESAAKLVILSARRLYPYPTARVRSVDDIELFVSMFRRIASSAIPPPAGGMPMFVQFLVLVASVIGIFVVRSISLRRMNGPLPPPSSSTSTAKLPLKTD